MKNSHSFVIVDRTGGEKKTGMERRNIPENFSAIDDKTNRRINYLKYVCTQESESQHPLHAYIAVVYAFRK